MNAGGRQLLFKTSSWTTAAVQNKFLFSAASVQQRLGHCGRYKFARNHTYIWLQADRRAD